MTTKTLYALLLANILFSSACAVNEPTPSETTIQELRRSHLPTDPQFAPAAKATK